MLDIVVIVIPALAGLALFALLRQRNTQVFLAGVAAFALALLVMAGIFGAIIVSGSY
jgi:hypothetical protein